MATRQYIVGAIVIALAILLATLSLSPAWRACCEALNDILHIVFFPGYTLEYMMGWNGHGISKDGMYFGMILGLLAEWGCLLLILKRS